MVNLNREIQLQPGSTMNLRLSSGNTGISDSIKLTSTASTVLPGATFTTDNAKQQTAIINWTPTIADAAPQPYIFTVMLQDRNNALAQYPYTIRIRVSTAGGITGKKEETKMPASFSAFPNPFTEEINFKINRRPGTETIIIYNALGQEIDRIALKTTNEGNQIVRWLRAAKYPSGTYMAKLFDGQTLRFNKL